MVYQHVDKVFKEARLAGTEEAIRYLVNGLLQLRDAVVVRQSIIAKERERFNNVTTGIK